MKVFVSLAFLAAVTSGCQSASASPPMPAPSDLQAVSEVIAAYRISVNAGDIERLLAIASDDLEVIPPGEQALKGAAAHQLLRGLLNQFTIQLQPFTDEEIVVSGDWAFQRYTYELSLKPKAGGDSVVERGHGIHIFRREADGSWRLVKDFFSSVPKS